MRLLIFISIVLPLLFTACEQGTDLSLQKENENNRITLSKALTDDFSDATVTEKRFILKDEGDYGLLSLNLRAEDADVKAAVSFEVKVPLENGIIIPGVYRTRDGENSFNGWVTYSSEEPGNVRNRYSFKASSMKLTILSADQTSLTGSLSILSDNEQAKRYTKESVTDINLSYGGLLGTEADFSIFNAEQ